MGNYTSVGRYTKIRSADIGKYCSISWDVTIGAVEHPLTKLSTAALTYKSEYNLISKDKEYPQKRTVIGNDVWIGCNVVIRSGVKVGDGAVIGTGSVCVKDVPPYSIVVGNPAHVLRMRTEEENVKRLLQLAWWDWSTDELKQNIDLLSEELTDDLICKLEKFNELRTGKEK
ncbi:TPA: CatB-related O-acetyltransferase [Enterococcus faecium]|nr:CatB-related O-acetyltransferase [Enterococcus faecium]